MKHLKEQNMTYLQHFLFALALCSQLVILSVAALIHAVIPFIFTTFVSDKIYILNKMLDHKD